MFIVPFSSENSLICLYLIYMYLLNIHVLTLLYTADLLLSFFSSCECPHPVLLWQWHQAASLRDPFSPQLSLKPPCPVTFPCGMALVHCAHPSPPGGSFHSSWATVSSPPNRYPFSPLHLTWAWVHTPVWRPSSLCSGSNSLCQLYFT